MKYNERSANTVIKYR